MDDFGTGYSSLNYLKRMPVNTVKIDCSFIKDIAADADSAAIVRSIIVMSHTMKKEVYRRGCGNGRSAGLFGRARMRRHARVFLQQAFASGSDYRDVAGRA